MYHWFVCVCVCVFCHRPTPAGVHETGGQQDISLYEIQDSSVQGSATVYLKFPPFVFHFSATTTKLAAFYLMMPATKLQ